MSYTITIIDVYVSCIFLCQELNKPKMKNLLAWLISESLDSLLKICDDAGLDCSERSWHDDVIEPLEFTLVEHMSLEFLDSVNIIEIT